MIVGILANGVIFFGLAKLEASTTTTGRADEN